MDGEPAKRNDVVEEGDGTIHWTVTGGMPEVPKIELPAEVAQSLSDTSKRYSDMFASVAAISEAYSKVIPSMDTIRESVNSISSVLANLPDYTSMVQGMYPALAQFAENVKLLVSTIDLNAVSESFRRTLLERQRAELLVRAKWPLFLVDDVAVCSALDELMLGDFDEGISERVSEIACKNLDSEWLDETLARWAEHDELSDGVRALLDRAVKRHENGDYEGCVALLMNLFEGLIEKYLPKANLNDGQIKEFDVHAGRHGLRPLRIDENKLRRLSARDRVLLMMMLADDGMYAIRCAVDYIVDVVLTGKMDDALAARNPLRNKICHGDQTEYDTKEHSLKAILVTDIMIRLGSAVLALQVDAECDGESQGGQTLP